MPQVTALGELLIDFTFEGANADGYPVMSAHPGGAPSNFLAALAKRGVSTALITKVGDDALGRQLKQTVGDIGIDASGVLVDPSYFTTLAFVTLDQNGDRTFSFARKPGADTQLTFDEIPLHLIDDCAVFHIGTLSLTDEPSRSATYRAVAYAKSRGCLISLDPNLRLPLWPDADHAKREMLWALGQADIVKISEDEVDFLFGMDERQGAAHILQNFGVSLVFVTLGKNGCFFMNEQGSGYVENYNNVKTVDTCGAGDIFGGTALYGVLQSGKAPQALTAQQLHDIADFACATASLSTAKHGGISSVPERDDIVALMAQKR